MSVRAVKFAMNFDEAVFLSRLNLFEYENALRLAEFRKLISAGQRLEYFSLFHEALSAGRLAFEDTNLADVLAEAGRISEAHTPGGGHRGFDILHVAAAKKIGATDFLTFDQNQRKLARAVGLNVPL